MATVSVARDFTRYPAGRYKKNGNTSGEGFRERWLQEPLSRGEAVTVDLDGTLGYGSSFLEEAFGGIVRALRLPADKVLALLTIQSEAPELAEEVRQYILDASAKLR